ncbi:MAG: MBL fold metallo-hydrolase [Bacillota bacterium]
MKVTFCGAAKTVTGSCYLVETDTVKFIVDCGMFQGPKHVRQLNYRGFLFKPSTIDFVVLTHAHIDHSGLLPKLVKEGFSGKIFATTVTTELSAIMLPDSAHIQEHDVEIANRKGRRLGRTPIEPLYTVHDAERTLTHFLPLDYAAREQLADNVSLTFRDAGHILGSAIAEIEITEAAKTTKLVFSGDLGQYHQPIVRDPEYIKQADYLFIESTYGLRNRDSFDKEAELAKALNEIIDQGGNCVIPAFAVGRTQLVLYYLVKLMRAGKIPKVPVFLDSPLGIAATKIFGRHPEVYDDDAKITIRLDKIIAGGDIDLRIAVSAEDSKRINDLDGAKIIISSSGMADAGRILHHLKHNLWSARNGVFFMGYQAEGTLGRRLLEGAKLVKIVGEEIVVKAKIFNFEGFSAHADRDELLDWLKHFEQPPTNVFVMHGEPEVATQFAKDITELLGYAAMAPDLGDSANIAGLSWTLDHSDFVMPEATSDKLQNYFVLVETDYMDFRRRVEALVAKDPTRTADVARRLEKLHNVFNKMITKLK